MVEFSHPIFGNIGRPQGTQANEPIAKVEPVEEPTISTDDLRSLIECGKVTATVEVDGKPFRMSTLADDTQETIFRNFSSTASDAAGFVELRRLVVAMSVETFCGRPFEDLYPADAEPKANILEKKLTLVRKMQGSVVDRLYMFYEELLKRSKQRVEPEQVKN